jgi:CubicO group peptidase (beta-lactamase class C family)
MIHLRAPRRWSGAQLLTLVLLLAAPSLHSVAAASYTKELQAGRATIQQLILASGIPGLSVTVAVDGKVLWSKGYGYADVENRIPATPRTLMRIGSISKSMTATAVARAVAAGKMDVDKSVREYLPALPVADDPITLRELGGHLGGLRTYRSPSEKTVYQHYDSISRALSIFADDPLANAPGTKFLYTSYGFVLLSAAAERATSREFLDFLRIFLWAPLNMSRTTSDDVRQIIDGRSRQYEKDPQDRIVNAAFSDDSYKLAGSGMLSTSDDLAALGNALVADKFLDSTLLSLLFTPQSTVAGESTGYGFGWFVDMEKFLDDHRGEIPAAQYLHLKEISSGRKLIWHSGTANGATAMLLLVPTTKVVVAIICNLGGIEPQVIVAAMEVETALSRARMTGSRR